MLNKMMKNKKGFTLIELIVVIAILGILAAVLVPSIGNYITRANNSAAQSNAKAVQSSALRIVTDIQVGAIATPASADAFAALVAADTGLAVSAGSTAPSSDGLVINCTATDFTAIYSRKGSSVGTMTKGGVWTLS